LGPAAQQSRPLGLVAVISAAGSRGVSREHLLVYFWPESTPKSARNTLNQTLYALRRDLDAPELFLPGRVLRLNPEVVSSDQWEFESALSRREMTEAAALYRGSYLQNFTLPGAPEFERWLEGERDRLAQRYFQTLSALATRASDKGDYREAADWWRKLATQDPLSSYAAAGLITALTAAGDRSAALAFARQHELSVTRELGVPVDPAIAALISRIETDRQPPTTLVTAPQVKRALEDLSGFERFTRPVATAGRAGWESGPRTSSAAEKDAAQLPKAMAPSIETFGGDLYKMLVENAIDIVYCADVHGNFTYANKASEKLLGVPRENIIGHLFLDFVREDFRHAMVELYIRQVHERVPVTYYEFPAVPPNGPAVWLGQHVHLVEHDGRPVGIFAIARDITLRKRLERNQGYLSVRDRSTKLLNAGAFRAFVEHRMSLALRSSQGFHVLFIRIENMNDISSAGGPAAAEIMAQHVADALRLTFRTSDILARLQPEEFAVVAVDAGGDGAAVLNQRFMENLNRVPRAPVPLVRVSHAYYDPKFPGSVESLFTSHSLIST